MIKTKRVYEQPSADDGYRVLTERLWPRGVSKERAALNKWMKGIAPSHELRNWFNHEESKWEEFQEQYRKELFGSESVQQLLEIIEEEETVTLIYAAKNEEYNSTKALKDFLKQFVSSGR